MKTAKALALTMPPQKNNGARNTGGRMKRRKFITMIGGSALVWSRAVYTQQTTMPVIAFPNGASYKLSEHLARAFQA